MVVGDGALLLAWQDAKNRISNKLNPTACLMFIIKLSYEITLYVIHTPERSSPTTNALLLCVPEVAQLAYRVRIQ